MRFSMILGDLDIAARTVWAEVRGHSYGAYVHVARVMVNRVLSNHRREVTLAGVCTEPYQFSCWLPHDPNYKKLLAVDLSDVNFRMAHRAVLEAVDMNPHLDPTQGSLHYLTPAIHLSTSWAKDKIPVFEDDAHRFFNNVN